MLMRVLTTILLTSVLLMSGCATRTKMAFSEDSDKEIKTNNPIFLMTSTMQNNYKTSFQPRLIAVNVERAVVKDSADRINFVMDDKAKNETKANSQLLRMELEKGEYVIRGLSGMASIFPFNCMFFAPMHSTLRSSEPGVFYLGHVEAIVRERKEGEFKAGPSIPVIDQAVAGASTGTFDIEISDQWDKDEPQFRAKFPALKGAVIQKAILPPFDRKAAQTWWETN